MTVFGLLAIPGSAVEEPLRISGSTTVNPVVSQGAEALVHRGELTVRIDTLGGSSGGILCLAEGRCDLAMSSRPISDDDRQRFPEADFREHRLGWDAVAIVVARDVWEAGVHSLDATQLRRLYERRVLRWSEVGGPDRRVVFFDKEPGRGTWEVFAAWLYGSARSAPTVAHLTVGANEEVRAKVSSTPGAISQLSAAWADGERVFALALPGPGGLTRPTAANIRDGSYPLVRPLLLVSRGAPSPAAQRLIDYLTEDEGSKLLAEHGYLRDLDTREAIAP